MNQKKNKKAFYFGLTVKVVGEPGDEPWEAEDLRVPIPRIMKWLKISNAKFKWFIILGNSNAKFKWSTATQTTIGWLTAEWLPIPNHNHEWWSKARYFQTNKYTNLRTGSAISASVRSSSWNSDASWEEEKGCLHGLKWSFGWNEWIDI